MALITSLRLAKINTVRSYRLAQGRPTCPQVSHRSSRSQPKLTHSHPTHLSGRDSQPWDPTNRDPTNSLGSGRALLACLRCTGCIVGRRALGLAPPKLAAAYFLCHLLGREGRSLAISVWLIVPPILMLLCMHSAVPAQTSMSPRLSFNCLTSGPATLPTAM